MLDGDIGESYLVFQLRQAITFECPDLVTLFSVKMFVFGISRSCLRSWGRGQGHVS